MKKETMLKGIDYIFGIILKSFSSQSPKLFSK